MRLSKKEAKYRVKIIQEWHLKKEDQREIDKAATETGKSYRRLYTEFRLGIFNGYFAAISIRRVSKAFKQAGVSAQQAAEAFSALAAAGNNL